MHRRRGHFHERVAAHTSLMPKSTAAITVPLNPRCIATPRASWKVCPKHRNIRREFQRVRGRESQRQARLHLPGKGNCSFRTAQPCRPSVAEVIPSRAPRGGSWAAVLFIFMKPADPNPKEVTIRAAAYVRMSTEHQQYSTHNQRDAINEYAARRSLEIVQIYSDEGKSGLSIQGRDSLAQLISDVQEGRAEFSCILVYDVSRWGRFQDADESAYYEYICRRAGIAVHYCAEQFENDGSPVATIVKSVKRAMAGEYSRELSSKVFQGACRLVQMGFRQGGTAGFGLRRMLIDQSGQQKGMLKIGEQKSIQTDRVILVPGPEDELATVRWMYGAFVSEGKNERQIADVLNERATLTDFGRRWTRGTVHEVLTNEKYIGNNLYYRTSFKLKQTHVVNPPERWIRADGVFQSIIEPTQFFTAQGIILARSRRLTDEEMLEKLRAVHAKHGQISGLIIDEEDDTPSSAAFRHRFGSLVRAYRLVGYTPEIDYGFLEMNRALRERHGTVLADVVAKLREVGAMLTQDENTGLLTLDGELAVSIVIARHRLTDAGFSRWLIRFDGLLMSDITIAVRMAAGNADIKDFYLLPALDMTASNLRFAEHNGVWLDAYRFDSLDFFYGMARRCQVEDVA
jgi:DNA invertase Pin-like site-specific DNA recombinase